MIHLMTLLLLLLLLSRFSRVRLCATPQTAAHQALPYLGFSRQERWSGLSFPSPLRESEKWKWSCSVESNSWWPHGLQPTRLLHLWDFLGKSTGVACHCLLCYTLYGTENHNFFEKLFAEYTKAKIMNTAWHINPTFRGFPTTTKA